MSIMAWGLAALSAVAIQWEEGAKLPLARAGYCSGILEGRMVVAGGTRWQNGRKVWTDRVDVYELSTDVWHQEASLPDARSDSACVVIGDSLYLLGGVTDGQETRADAVVFRDGRWTRRPEIGLPAPRVYARASVIGSDLYVIGGMARYGDESSATDTVWVNNLSGPEGGWTALPSVPGRARWVFALENHNDHLYLFGGASQSDKGWSSITEAWEFDPSRQQWRRLADLPQARRAMGVVSWGAQILLLGGYTSTFRHDVIEYSPENNVYRPIGNLPEPLADAVFLGLPGGRIIVSGGEAGPQVRSGHTWLGTPTSKAEE